MKSMKDLKRFSKEWWKNYFFYYKWHTLIALIAIVLIVGTVIDMATRVEPDIYLLFSGDYVLSDEDRDLLKSRCQQAISDINNDGQIMVQFVEIPLLLDSEKTDETTAASNHQMQMQFATGEQHIYVLDRQLFQLYDGQELLDKDTLCVETKDSPFFEGTALAERDAIMVTRVKRHDFESDFTTSQQLIDYWNDK
ncbi:MAG: hypothetical protein J6A61_03730 [Clostridia bacterium]|nr:hypothetical protein [Clostridia bacterium]